MVRVSMLAVITASILFHLGTATSESNLNPVPQSDRQRIQRGLLGGADDDDPETARTVVEIVEERDLQEREPLIQPNGTQPAITSAPVLAPVSVPSSQSISQPSCEPDVPYLILANIDDGADICSGYLGLQPSTTSSTVYLTEYGVIEVETAPVPIATVVDVRTTTIIEVVTTAIPITTNTLTATIQTIATTVVKRSVVATPPHVQALPTPRISSACSCLATTPLVDTITVSVITFLETGVTTTTTTPATVTEQVTSVVTETTTTTTTPAAATPNNCAVGTEAFQNPGFDDNANSIAPWIATNGDQVPGPVANLGAETSAPYAVALKTSKFISGGALTGSSLQQTVTLCKGGNYDFNMRFYVLDGFTRDDTEDYGIVCYWKISLGDTTFPLQDYNNLRLPGGTIAYLSLGFPVAASTETAEFKISTACRDVITGADVWGWYVVVVDDFSLKLNNSPAASGAARGDEAAPTA